MTCEVQGPIYHLSQIHVFTSSFICRPCCMTAWRCTFSRNYLATWDLQAFELCIVPNRAMNCDLFLSWQFEICTGFPFFCCTSWCFKLFVLFLFLTKHKNHAIQSEVKLFNASLCYFFRCFRNAACKKKACHALFSSSLVSCIW